MITGINFANIYKTQNPFQVRNISFKGISKPEKLQADTFEKKTPTVNIDVFPKENGELFNKFVNYAKESDLTSKISEIVDNPENYIGEGYEGETYEIPGNDDWVVKRFFRTHIIPVPTERPTIKEIKDITPGINVGQNVATVETPCGKERSFLYYILRKQKGSPVGISLDLSDIVTEKTTTRYLKSLKNLSEAPVSSYDKLISDTARVSECGYEFDYNNPDNFLFDKETQEISFVDINDKTPDKGAQHEKVLFALLSGNFYKNFKNHDGFETEKKKADEEISVITQKYTDAMLKQNAEFTDNKVTDFLIEYGILCADKENETVDAKKEFLRGKKLLNSVI